MLEAPISLDAGSSRPRFGERRICGARVRQRWGAVPEEGREVNPIDGTLELQKPILGTWPRAMSPVDTLSGDSAAFIPLWEHPLSKARIY